MQSLFSGEGDSTPAVQGGSEAAKSQCPEGHELQAWSARAGTCDGCGAGVQEGETVMDCRWCDWYLCKVCLPVYQAQSSSLWSAVSSLPVYAMDAVTKDVGTLLASAGVVDAPKQAPQKAAAGATPQARAASVLMTDFCENYSALPGSSREPTEAELESLYAKCSLMPPEPVAEALCEQLSWVADFMWPPKLRALCALEHFHRQGGEGREVSKAVVQRAGRLLQQLTGVPQCKEKAIEVIRCLREQAASESTIQEECTGAAVDVAPNPPASSAGKSSDTLVPSETVVPAEPPSEDLLGMSEPLPPQPAAPSATMALPDLALHIAAPPAASPTAAPLVAPAAVAAPSGKAPSDTSAVAAAVAAAFAAERAAADERAAAAATASVGPAADGGWAAALAPMAAPAASPLAAPVAAPPGALLPAPAAPPVASPAPGQGNPPVETATAEPKDPIGELDSLVVKSMQRLGA